MKKIVFMLLLCFGLSITSYSQGGTQGKLAATITNPSSTLLSGTVNTVDARYTVSATFADPAGKYTASNLTVGMIFIDGSCKMYQLTAVNSTNFSGAISINVKPLGTQPAELGAPSNGISGLVFAPTPNLFLPQWVYNMSANVQSCLFSHMANLIDAKIGNSVAPSIQIKTGSYVLANSDDTVLFEIGVASTLTLPEASANPGKVFKIGKVDETTNVLTISPAIKLTASTTITTLNYPRTFMVQSDGISWRVINQY